MKNKEGTTKSSLHASLIIKLTKRKTFPFNNCKNNLKNSQISQNFSKRKDWNKERKLQLVQIVQLYCISRWKSTGGVNKMRANLFPEVIELKHNAAYVMIKFCTMKRDRLKKLTW